MTSGDSERTLTDLIASAPFFAALHPAALDDITRDLARKDYGANEVIVVEGEPSGGLYIVQAGWVKAVKIAPDGREQVLRFLGPGETFNPYGVFVSDPNPATIIALEPATLLLVPRETVLRLLDTYPAFARAVIQDMAHRLQHLVSLVEDLSLRTVESRLARYLLDSAEGDVLERRRWATQAEIAARLGTVTDVLNRAFRALADDGLIRVSRYRIQIIDRAGLRARAGIEP